MPQHSAAWVRVQPPANAHPGRRQHQAGLGSLPTHGRAGDAAPGRVRQRPGGRLPPARELTGLSERRERDGGFPSRLGARTNSRGGRARLTGRLSGRTLGPRRPQPHGDGRTTPLARRGRRGTRTRSPVARAPPSPLGHAQVPRGGSPREPPEKPPRGSPSSGPAALGHGRLCGLPRPLTRRRRHPPFSRLGHSKAGSARRRAGPCPQGCPRVGSGELARPEPAASPLPASRLVRAATRGQAQEGAGLAEGAVPGRNPEAPSAGERRGGAARAAAGAGGPVRCEDGRGPGECGRAGGRLAGDRGGSGLDPRTLRGRGLGGHGGGRRHRKRGACSRRPRAGAQAPRDGRNGVRARSGTPRGGRACLGFAGSRIAGTESRR